MSSLHCFLLGIFLTIQCVENQSIFFTRSIYEVWCQENHRTNARFLYPDRILPGIARRTNIKSIVYQLIDQDNLDLFTVQNKRLADIELFVFNLTRPLEINREYQDHYQFYIQAQISTDYGNITEQAEIHVYVADSNDNDGVFDMDVYDRTFSELLAPPQVLLRFHASDADEIHHAQTLYELSLSSLTEIFSLHPFTGDLYLISQTNLQSTYEFDIYAYDRHRKDLMNSNIKAKTHVILRFPRNDFSHRVRTIDHQTIEFIQLISVYNFAFNQNSNWNLLNIHQAILTIGIPVDISSYEIFLLENSSSNARNLFFDRNEIYLTNHFFENYHLKFLICFFNRTKCQRTNYDLFPTMDLDAYGFHLKSLDRIYLDEDLLVHSFITNIQLEYEPIYSDQLLIIHYRLLNDDDQFRLHPHHGILRLARELVHGNYSLNIQVDISLSNQSYSVKGIVQIHVKEINKYPPIFSNETMRKSVRFPYRFHAIDFDQNEQTNSRITYRLWNCPQPCPFEIHPTTGLFNLRYHENFLPKQIYHPQILAFDWGEPISFESKLNLMIDLSKKDDQSITILKENSAIQIPSQPIDLHIGFQDRSSSYHLSEETSINQILDYLQIEYDDIPSYLTKDHLFYFLINETTSIPFVIDQHTRTIRLIQTLDREKRDHYTFEIEFRLKSSYQIKFQEIYQSNFRITNKYYQKKIINVYIDDVNDHIPRCVDVHQRIMINENQIQTNIFQVRAFDLDRGENGTIVYSLLDYKQYFTIHSQTGQIHMIQSIDYEQFSSIHLHILASDQGTQPQLQSLCMTLHIIIWDINENIPQFSITNHTFEVFSDLPRNAIFAQVYATDADVTDQLIYSIDFNPYVDINQHTGHLRVKQTLHPLVSHHFNLTVRVFDGLHINQTSIDLYIQPFPKAQEPILVSQPAYEIILNQSLSIGTIVTNVYHDFKLRSSTIDFVEILPNEHPIVLVIDQQGSLRLIDSLPNVSFWIILRLTRYRAHPPHSFVHIHLSIREDNFYLPQCVHIYQNLTIYPYSIPYPLARVQAVSLYDSTELEYGLIDNEINEKFFAVNRLTGSIQLLPAIQLEQSDFLLTVRALDKEHHLSVNCFVKIHAIQRRELTPKFYYPSIYFIDMTEIPAHSPRLRQRLFQVIALLDHPVYHRNLHIRYRIVDLEEYFIINPQTGYIAAKRSLEFGRTYQLNIEAYTVAYTDKWRVVSSRAFLAVQIRVIQLQPSSLILRDQSIINLDLFTTTKVGSKLLQLGVNNNQTKWFVLISSIEYTRYFHVNSQSGELILLRSIEELIDQTSLLELYINVTNNWIDMQTIRILIHLKNVPLIFPHFSQTDYYTSISRTAPIGMEISRLTLNNPSINCTYEILSVERIHSKQFFRIDSRSASIIIAQSLVKSSSDKHLLTIIYQCQDPFQIASTRLHIDILENKSLEQRKNIYRFSQENYLIVFATSFTQQQKKYLMDFQLVNNENPREKIPSDVQIIQGDPLGLFSIDSSNQSLVLLDESRTRSYTYPLRLTIMDTTQRETLTCIVTILISNIAIQFTCPPDHLSPYLFTYQSLPANTLDRFTGQRYGDYHSMGIHGFDPLSPEEPAECSIQTSPVQAPLKNIDFLFEKDLYQYIYHSQQLLQLSIKNLHHYSQPLDITYQFINQTLPHSFQIDPHTGLLNYPSTTEALSRYSFLILAKYHSFMALTRLNVIFQRPKHSIYRFQLYRPLVDNYTIGYVYRQNVHRRVTTIFAVDPTGRLFLPNSTLIPSSRTFYEFLLEKSRVQIEILSKEIIQCTLDRLNLPDGNPISGFITTTSSPSSQKRAFHLLNYHHLFFLNEQQGLLQQRHTDNIIPNDLKLLIEIENARCILNINEVLFSHDATRIRHESYHFSLDITNNFNKTIFVGQILAQPSNINRSHLIYRLLSWTNEFVIHPDHGIIEYIPNGYEKTTIKQLQIITHDLIYQEDKTINVIISIFKSERLPLSSMVYYQTISESLPSGSIIFEPNISSTEFLSYSLRDSYSNLFIIDSSTGQITLLNSPSDWFYRLTIDLSPINHSLILQLTILDWNNHAPIFSHLPFNLTISSDDIFVTKLSAYDPDLSDNQRLKYYLLDTNQRNIFSINSTTGIITLNNPFNQTFVPLEIGVTDGLHLTTAYLPITITDYARNLPRFSSDEYIFQYQTSLGSIVAYDLDANDRISYQLHLQPDGIQIDADSGLITITRKPYSSTLQFFASASDRAEQIVYTRIQIFLPIEPRFSSHLYHISLLPSVQIPSEVFRFQLVDAFNQPLSFTQFTIEPSTHFRLDENRLILMENYPSARFVQLDIYGYWKNFTCRTLIRVAFAERLVRIKKKFYEFSIDKRHLKENYSIDQFYIKNSRLKILPTPLTNNDCIRNFDLKDNQLYFRNYPILSDLCFFELELTHERSIFTSLIQISLIDVDLKPIFSSAIYHFHHSPLRVFAQSTNKIRYKLSTNPYGLIINQTTGMISQVNSFTGRENLRQAELLVHAIDDQTNLNDTALIRIIPNEKKVWKVPLDIALCPNARMAISERSLPGTIIQDLQVEKNNHLNRYYVLFGDRYGLFAINDLGQLYLSSSMLNRTLEEFFELIILRSSFSITHCRTNVSITRIPRWSDFICPPTAIEWIVKEESPIGTRVGNIKEILSMINNNSLLINQIQIKSKDIQAFHLNSSTGLILSKTRLDYEQQSVYSFTVFLEPHELHCSLFIRIQLININDHPIDIDRQSLTYSITQTYPLPFYLGRIRLLSSDPFYSYQYQYFLSNTSSDLFIDSTTGSIILLSNLHRDQLQYEVILTDVVNHRNITDILKINIDKFNSDSPILFNLRTSIDHSTDTITHLYLSYPSINTVLYTIDRIDIDQWNLNGSIVNDTSSSYHLRSTPNSMEIILNKFILHNREDNLIIRFWNQTTRFSDIKLRLIYHQCEINYPKILSQTIEGYLNLEKTSFNVNLGQLLLQNHSQYQFVYFHLQANKYFSLEQVSNNRTDLYYHSSPQSSLGEFRINLTAIGLMESIPQIDFSKNMKVFFPTRTTVQSIDIYLWSIDREMVNRTVALVLPMNPNEEELILDDFPAIRQALAGTIRTDIDHVHIYTFALQGNQIELLFTVFNSISHDYLDKKFLYNALKTTYNTSHPCPFNACEIKLYCPSSVYLLTNQYRYVYWNAYQRILPKYQWDRTASDCEFLPELTSPCSSNPCLPMEKCLEKSPTSYTCQCIDTSCRREKSWNCININSPTCRDSSKTLTLKSYSEIRLNFTFEMAEYLMITFSFRTYSTDGKLLQLIYDDERATSEHGMIVHIINGYLIIKSNGKILLEFNDIIVNDGLWHDFYLFLDESHALLRLDHVFSGQIIRSKQIHHQLLLGSDYHGCLGNLSLNNQPISLSSSPSNLHHSLQLFSTTIGCQLPSMISNDICSFYNPCYHGGRCINENEMSFICNCSNPRFTGRQCQIDTHPCASHPCSYNEECVPIFSNAHQSFQCIRLSRSINRSFYIGCILAIGLVILFVGFICYFWKKPRKEFFQNPPFVSAPLLIQKSSTSMVKPSDGTMQTLLPSDDRVTNQAKVEEVNAQVHYSTIDDDLCYDDHGRLYINSLSNFPEESDFDTSDFSNDYPIGNPHAMIFDDDPITMSTASLPKMPIYARIVKTARVRKMFESTSTTIVGTNEMTINYVKHASDSDLFNEEKSRNLSSFFQTDV